MSAFGIFAALWLAWALGWPRPFGRHLAEIASAYREAMATKQEARHAHQRSD